MRTLRTMTLVAASALIAAGCLPALDGSNTGPDTDPTDCQTTETGTVVISTGGTAGNPLVIDGLCLNGGGLVIDADYVTVTQSELTADPSTNNPYPIFVDDGHHGIVVTDNILDCGPASEGTPVQTIGILTETGAKHGTPSLPGLYLDVQRNEVRDCTDGFQLASNSYYGHNLVHQPDNTDDSHADGVQWTTEDDGVTGIHDTVFEWNTIHWPAGSSAFQFHNNPGQPASSWPTRITVRYNWFQGGAAVVRLPGRNCDPTECGGVDLEFYGNRLNRLVFTEPPTEFLLCDGDADTISVWGPETGDPTDSLPSGDPDGVVDDENINHEAGFNVPLTRANCNG